MIEQAQRDELLQLLQRNARLTADQLAERLMLPAAEVADLIAEWEADGTLLGYHAVVHDDLRQQAQVRAMIEVSVDPERDSGFDRTARCIAKFRQVTDLMLVSGNYDLLLFVTGDSLQEVADFVASKLAPLRGVRSTRTHFMLKRYKEAGFTLVDDEEYERLQVTP